MNDLVFSRTGLSPGMEVLDLGAGSGCLLSLLACRFGDRGTGIAISELAVRRVLQRQRGDSPHGSTPPWGA